MWRGVEEFTYFILWFSLLHSYAKISDYIYLNEINVKHLESDKHQSSWIFRLISITNKYYVKIRAFISVCWRGLLIWLSSLWSGWAWYVNVHRWCLFILSSLLCWSCLVARRWAAVSLKSVAIILCCLICGSSVWEEIGRRLTYLQPTFCLVRTQIFMV